MNQPITQIGVEELAVRIRDCAKRSAKGEWAKPTLRDRESPLQLIDVREPHEVEIAYLEGFEVLPLSQFERWSNQIKTNFDPEVETAVMCHHGIRSAQMCQWLQQNGFTNVKNVAGGIDAYSLLVDPSIPRY